MINNFVKNKSGMSDIEIQNEIVSNEKLIFDRERWSSCYFHRVNSELMHDEGTCKPCDWKRHINSVSKERLRNFDFIEAWEWDEVWERKYNNK